MIKTNCDFHIHSNISFDGLDSIESIVDAAVTLGLETIAFTEHIDFEGAEGTPNFCEEKLAFANCEVARLNEIHKGKIKILCGAEIGYDNRFLDKFNYLIEKYNFNYIINSVHANNGVDYIEKTAFMDKEKAVVFNKYLDIVLESISAPYPYHTIGHLGYLARYAPYENKDLLYSDFKVKIDKILTAIVAKDKFLEINARVVNKKLRCLPTKEILTAFRLLGGKTIFGSDSHSAKVLLDTHSVLSSCSISL